MKNANELKEITNTILTKRAEEKEKRIKEYVENNIAPKLEASANKGYDFESIAISAFIDKERVKEILIENGYTVEDTYYDCMMIRW